MQLIGKLKSLKARRRDTIKSSWSGGASAVRVSNPRNSTEISPQEQEADGTSTPPHTGSLLSATRRAGKGHRQNLRGTRTRIKACPGGAIGQACLRDSRSSGQARQAALGPVAGTHCPAVSHQLSLRPVGTSQRPKVALGV